MSVSEALGAITLGTSPGLKTGESEPPEPPEPLRSAAISCVYCAVCRSAVCATALYSEFADIIREVSGNPVKIY